MKAQRAADELTSAQTLKLSLQGSSGERCLRATRQRDFCVRHTFTLFIYGREDGISEPFNKGCGLEEIRQIFGRAAYGAGWISCLLAPGSGTIESYSCTITLLFVLTRSDSTY